MRLTLRAVAALAALPLSVLPAGVSQAALPPATYLALGDSVAAGVGASRPELGYVPLVANALLSARQCGADQTAGCLRESVNLSVSGATTTSLIATQLPAATSLLQTRNTNATAEDDVRLITLTIGGNDLFQPVIAACQTPTAPACTSTVATQLQQVATNAAVILGRLRAAAGRDTTIAVTTYYNGLAAPGCPAAALSGLAQVVLEGGPGVPAGLNDILRQAAQATGAVVVETAPVVEPTEIRPDCLHPTDQGHADIAGAVARTVLSNVIGGGTPPPTVAVDRAVIEAGGAHQLTVTGRAGGAVQLFGNGRVIRTGTIPASGQLGFTLQPRDRTVFSASVDGVRSAAVEVRVRRAVSIGIRQPVRGVYVFSGTIDRPEAGVQVTVARLDSETKRVTGVASTRTTSDGRYEISTSLPVGFAGYYALTSATPQLDAGRSRLYGLLVNTRPAPAETISLDVGRGPGYYVFSGALIPGRSAPVTLARIVDGRSIGVAGGRSAANGGYVFRVPVRPGTHFFQVLTGTAKSRVYGLVVPQPVVTACSATSVRRSFDDSAQCMFRAYRRGDWAAVANYALPPVIALLRQSRAYDVANGFNWSYEGCGRPQYEDLGDFPPASSGVACTFYLNANPGEVHGVTLELNMDRAFRAESYSTVG